jgi:integrase
MKKNVNIYIPKGKSVYFANFRTQIIHPERGRMTVQINRSTNSCDRKTAQKIANNMRNEAALGRFEQLPKLREESPTCGQICDAFLATSPIKSKAQVCRDFLTVVAEGTGVADKAAARAVRLSALNHEAMLRFRSEARGRDASTVNALMRSAKSIFSKRAREFYRGFNLPAGMLEGWMKLSRLNEIRDKSFRRIPESVLAKMDRRARAMLRLSSAIAVQNGSTPRPAVNEWRNAWACYWLMRLCGLRNSEVRELRWEWFALREDGIFLELIERPHYSSPWRPKGSEGTVPVPRELYEELVARFGPARPGEEAFVLSGTPSDRRYGTQDCVQRFVRPFLPERTKCVYELRKQWGSDIAREFGIETAARLLRHKDLKTAWDHYIDDIKSRQVKAILPAATVGLLRAA